MTPEALAQLKALAEQAPDAANAVNEAVLNGSSSQVADRLFRVLDQANSDLERAVGYEQLLSLLARVQALEAETARLTKELNHETDRKLHWVARFNEEVAALTTAHDQMRALREQFKPIVEERHYAMLRRKDVAWGGSVRGELSFPPATPAKEPIRCNDCDGGYRWPGGYLCATCKGTTQVPPATPKESR